MADKQYWENLEKELKSLDQDAYIMDVPEKLQPTPEHLEKMNARLSIGINQNIQKEHLAWRQKGLPCR